MRKTFFLALLTILYIIPNLFSQPQVEKGRYRFVYFIQVNGGNYNDECNNYYWVDIPINQSLGHKFHHTDKVYNSYSYNATEYFDAAEFQPNSTFTTFGQRQYHDWGKCVTDGHSGNKTPDFTPNFDLTTMYNETSADCIVGWNGTITIFIYPEKVEIAKPPTNENQLFNNKTNTLYATTGFGKAIYKWQYSIDSVNWNYLPSNKQGYSSVTLNAMDLPLIQGDFLSHVGKMTHFRIEYGDGRYSNVRSLINTLEAPKITSINITDAKCNESTNGSIKVGLSRQLYPNETLKIIGSGQSAFTEVVTNANQAPDNSYTITNREKGTYTIKLSGTYRNPSAPGQDNTFPTFSDSTSLDYRRTSIIVSAPQSLYHQNVETTDVNCLSGSDGKFKVTIFGGTKPYTFNYKDPGDVSFSTQQIPSAYNEITYSDLIQGTYNFYITDKNNCRYPQSSGSTPVTIFEPDTSVYLLDTTYIEPLAYGYSDGSLIVEITGGTPNYAIEWRDSNNQVLATRTVTNINGKYIDTLKNIPAGKYTLVVKDNNYTCGAGSVTSNCQSCYYTGTFILNQPPPLEVEIIQHDSVLCYGTHEASIYAVAKGGVPYQDKPTGYRYDYQWYKKVGNTFEAITNQIDTITRSLYVGVYKVEIIDFNRIHKMSDEFTVGQPDSLMLSFSDVPASCSGREDGELTVLIQGGMLPHYIEWQGNADTTEIIKQMPAGTFLVAVTDRNNCRTYDRGTITTPTPIVISDSITPIACYNECNGRIDLQISGGVSPYAYNWEHGTEANLLSLANLCTGEYTIKITDSINCFVTQTFTLKNPLPVIVQLPDTITLCKDQTYIADAGQYIAYEWKKGSTNEIFSTQQTVELYETGMYILTSTTENGCKGADSIYIERDDKEIAADFLATTQALKGENIVLVNNSNPFAEKYEWIFPENEVKVLSADSIQAEVYFIDSGNYTVYLKAIDGKCNKMSEKQITILNETYFPDPGSVEEPFIREFKVYPNPSSGNFTIAVELKDKAPIRLRLIRLSGGNVLGDWQEIGLSKYDISCNLSLPTDSYALVLETGKGTQVLKIIVQ